MAHRQYGIGQPCQGGIVDQLSRHGAQSECVSVWDGGHCRPTEQARSTEGGSVKVCGMAHRQYGMGRGVVH